MYQHVIKMSFEHVNVIAGGGLPRGRVVEIAGDAKAANGRRALMLSAVAGAQRQGLTVAVLDCGNGFDPDVAVAHGVDIDTLLVACPTSGLAMAEIATALLKSKAVDLVVVAEPVTTPAVSIARVSHFLRNAAALCSEHGATLLFVSAVVPVEGLTFGRTEQAWAHNALPYYASLRMHCVAKSERSMTVKVIKNKLAAPFVSTVIGVVP